jgi:hypothetical protein
MLFDFGLRCVMDSPERPWGGTLRPEAWYSVRREESWQ